MSAYTHRKAALLFAVLAIFAFFISQLYTLRITEVLKEGTPISLPYSFSSKKGELTHYRLKVRFQQHASATVRIVPDDCLEKMEVNGVSVPLRNIPTGSLCNWSRGFKFDLGRYLVPGENVLDLWVRAKDSVAGLTIFPIFDSSNSYLLFWGTVALLFFLLSLYFIAAILQISKPLRILLMISVIVDVVYLSYTDFNIRTFDVMIHTGHFDYIKLLTNFHFPNPTQGWEYHQPPLYYLLAALVYKIATWLSVSPFLLLQLFSLLTFVLFLLFALRTIEYVLEHLWSKVVAAALILFWPSGVIHAIRLGNDVLFYALFAAAFFYLVRWYYQMRPKDLKIFALFAFLDFITKSNAIVLFIIAFLLGLVLWCQGKRIWKKESLWVVAAFVAAFAINFADNIYYALTTGADWLVSNVVHTINKKLYVSNEAINYLYFDFDTYLKEPFIDAWHDRYGRQYFWNYLLKSSLFSEFFFSDTLHKNLAVGLSFLSLGIVIFVIGYIISMKKEELLEGLPFFLLFFVFLAVLLAYRIKIPVACNTDFRYIYPIIIAIAYFYAKALNKLQKNGLVVLTSIGYLQIFLFASLSIFFFV